MQQFLNVTLTGLSQGADLRGVRAGPGADLAVDRIVNFAQGSMGMFTTYLALIVIEATDSYWLGLVVALLGGLALGASNGWSSGGSRAPPS